VSNTYLAQQLSGPLAQGVINTVQAQYALSDPIINYWYGLNIDNAASNELAGIGYLVGLPWPSSITTTQATNSMILGISAGYPLASGQGLSSVGSLSGGILWSNGYASAGLLDITSYRILLKAYAYLKWYGLSWVSIDKVASVFGNLSYTFSPTIANKFTLGFSAGYPVTDTSHGLSTYTGSTGGGLTSSNPGYFPDSDIIISYSTPLTLGNLYVLQTLFAAVCTAPKVSVRNGA